MLTCGQRATVREESLKMFFVPLFFHGLSPVSHVQAYSLSLGNVPVFFFNSAKLGLSSTLRVLD